MGWTRVTHRERRGMCASPRDLFVRLLSRLTGAARAGSTREGKIIINSPLLNGNLLIPHYVYSDQLWTNDGVFVAPDAGTEYPIELSEYPEVGIGWQNEEGIRIDMQHRLIPKLPLRPALKRGSTSNSSANSQQQQQSRPEARTHFSNNSIREEA